MSDENYTPDHALIRELSGHAQGFSDKTAAANGYSAMEELYVADKLLRASMDTPPADMTEERVELISRLAWAMSELINGYATRVPDDLEGVERLAEEVAEQDFNGGD